MAEDRAKQKKAVQKGSKDVSPGCPSKKDALAKLVTDGILTKQEYNSCLRALNHVASEKGLIYRDAFISVEYRGFEKQHPYTNKGFTVYLVVENKTQGPLTLSARVLVDDIIIEKDECIIPDIPEKSKIIAEIFFLYDRLKPLDIKKASDIKEIGLLFRCTGGKDHKEINKAKKIAKIYLK